MRKYPEDNGHHSEEESKVLPQVIHALSEHRVDPSGVHMFSHGEGTAHRFRPIRQVSHLLCLYLWPGSYSANNRCAEVWQQSLDCLVLRTQILPRWDLGTTLYMHVAT